jgi:predicted dehydrogenase
MRVAIVGCGYVADFYMTTLPNHAQVEVVGAYDRDSAAAERFNGFYGVKTYASLDASCPAPSLSLCST